MSYEKKFERNMPVCLECGDRIKYGRTDKRFCSDDCRSRHHYAQAKMGKSFRRRILNALYKNYDILEGVIRSSADSVDLMDLCAMGFTPSVVTSFRRCRKHDEYGCFDIKYIMTQTRVYSISKIQNFD